MNSPLSLKELIKDYGPVKAVRGVTLELEKGEIFGLLGPNGAGKTSIISCIVSLERPTSGSITVFGNEVTDQSQKARFDIGIVPQEIVNHGFFSVREILEFQSGFYGLTKNANRIDELLAELQLTEHQHKKVKQLSGGMKRRLMIAKALVHSPKLLLLDEPTAGVDIELRSHLWKFVSKLKAQGTTVLLTTHYLEEAEELCDRVGVIHRGQIVALDKTQNLIRNLTTRQLKLRRQGAESYETYPLEKGMNVGRWLSSNNLEIANIDDLTVEEGTLENAVRELLREKGV